MKIIAGTARGVTLYSPTDGKETTRPMLVQARVALFNILSEDVIKYKFVLDIFAGTGSLGLEALSRGACFGYFVEKSPSTLAILRKNIEKCQFTEKAKILKQDAFRVIPVLQEIRFDLIFFDPPYHYFDNPLTRREMLQYLDQIANQLALPNAWVITHCRRNTLAGMPLPKHLNLIDQREYGTTELLFFKSK